MTLQFLSTSLYTDQVLSPRNSTPRSKPCNRIPRKHLLSPPPVIRRCCSSSSEEVRS
ncbi:hypothetical protein LINPERPRIM_LOCUS11932 [Linum perenne]